MTDPAPAPPKNTAVTIALVLSIVSLLLLPILGGIVAWIIATGSKTKDLDGRPDPFAGRRRIAQVLGIANVALWITLVIVVPKKKTTKVASSSATATSTSSSTSTTKPPKTAATKAPVATAVTQPAVTYLGQAKHDHRADDQGFVSFASREAGTKGWARDANSGEICGAIAVRNGSKSTQHYNLFDWKLQAPQGHAEDSTGGGTLGSGDLAPSGTVDGTLCFPDKGEHGQYVVIWQPDTSIPDRGIWLVSL